MRFLLKNSFRKKLTAIVLCTAIVALLFAAIIFSLLEVFHFKQNLEYQASLVADIIATSTTPSLATKVPHEADSLLATLVSDPHVTAVFLFDEDGEPFAQYLRPVKNIRDGRDLFYECSSLKEGKVPEEDIRCFSWNHLGLFRSVYLDGKKIGTVYLQSDLELLYSRLQNSALSLFALLMQASFIAFLVAYPLQRIVTRPVLHLVERIKEVSQNDDFTVRAEKFSEDEIGILTDGFNEMLDHLEDHRNALLKYQEDLEHKIHERTIDLQEKNRELLSAKKAAESSSLAKSSFLANVSHELRTPMVGVLGIAELLLESDLTQKQRYLLQTLHKSGESLLEIFNDILDFSRIEADKMRLNNGEFNLWDIIEDSVELFGELGSKKNLDLVCDISPELPETLFGDAGRLRQVLVNLVGNAVKFTEKGEVRVVADMVGGLSESNIRLKIQVSDTGPGIDLSYQGSIFEAFTQKDESSSRQYGGAGLGLSIVKGIVDLMGGTIGLVSEPGLGTTFTIQVSMSLPGNHDHKCLSSSLDGGKVLVGGVSSALWQSLARQIEGAGGVALHAETEKDLTSFSGSLQDIRFILLDERFFGGKLPANALRKTLGSFAEEGRLLVFRRLGYETGVGLETYPHLFMPLPPSQIRGFLLSMNTDGSDLSVPNGACHITASEFKILVAEDNHDTQKLMKTLLETQGYGVGVAGCGFEVLSALEREQFDLILMDCQMPRLDGFETTRRLRSLGIEMPIIALTAHVSHSAAEECLQAGMNDFLGKPFKQNDLLRLLEKWMKSSPISRHPEEGVES